MRASLGACRCRFAVSVGIEALGIHAGTAFLDVEELCIHRGLDIPRFRNLLVSEKTVALPFEDPVTFAVNAARPIIDAMPEEKRRRIEMVITCSESGIDFGKSMSTYIHHYLGLQSNCRLFEIKQACYSGTAGLQMAVNFILSRTSPGAKALVVATDVSRFALADANAVQEWAYSEPSSGAGAVALLVGEEAEVLHLDTGAYGNHGFEVMDTCRPGPDTEAGDADLSLMAYLDCCEKAYADYARKVEGADLLSTFDYLAFHTPFGGMVKGAHRHLMRKFKKMTPEEIGDDFARRVAGSLRYGSRVGNTAGASVLLSLAGTIASADLTQPRRIGLFSYGSGCCSEFYSGVITPDSRARLDPQRIEIGLARRRKLSMAQYESLLRGHAAARFGTRDALADRSLEDFAAAPDGGGQPRLALREIKAYHRLYDWI